MANSHFSSLSGATSTIIGIAGGTGSGKTSIARALHQHLGLDGSLLLHADDYYRDQSHLSPATRSDINFDHPEAFDSDLLIEHLRALLIGTSIECPRYDFATHTRLPETVRIPAKPVIILEGLMVFIHVAVRDCLQLLVFVDTPDDVRFIRRLRRDVSDRGRTMDSVIEQYLATVRPMHQEFVEPTRTHAQVIVSGEVSLSTAVGTIVSHATFASVSPVGDCAGSHSL